MRDKIAKPDITTVLAEVASAVVGKFEMKALLDQIINTTMETLHAEVSSIFLIDEEEPNILKCVAGSGFAKEIVGIAKYEIGEGLTGTVAKTGKGYNHKNPEDHKQFTIEGKKVWKGKYDHIQWPSGKSEFRNGIGLPLKIKDQILGVIKAENKNPTYGNFFTDEDVITFKTIANVIALTIENARLHQKAEEQSKTLSYVASAVVGQFEMTALLDQIINTTMETLHAEVCSIFLEDKEEDPGILKCVAGSGSAKRIVNKAKYKIGEGFTGTIAKVGKEFNIKSLKDLENLEVEGKRVWKGKYDSIEYSSGKSKFRNCIALPLKIKDQILGVIKVENKDEKYGDSFTDDDLDILKTIANVIALTIENTKLHQKTEAQSKKLSAVLSDVAGAVVGKFQMKALLDQIINITMEMLHAEVSSIFLIDEEEPNVLKCVAGSGFAKRIVGIAKYEIGEGLTGTVAKAGEGYNTKSPKKHQEIEINEKKVWKGKYDHIQWPSGKSEFRNGIGLPLKIKDQILGVIKAENKDPGYGDFFTDEDVNIFKTIANVIALTIENARLHQKAEEQSKRLSGALADVASAVVGQFEMKALLNQIIHTTMETLRAEVCSIFLEDKEEKPGILTCVAGSGWAKHIVGSAKYKIGEGFTGTIANVGKEFNIKSREELENLEVDGKKVWKGKYDSKQYSSGKTTFRNCIALPLKIKDQILGVIKAENKDEKSGDYFTDEDLNTFKTIANVIALTIENARLYKQIEEQLKTIAAKAAHRINNQVTSYDGIELDLLDEVEAKESKKKNLRNLLKRLKNTTENLKSMINDFKNYGKPIELVKTNNDINEVITNEIWQAGPPESIKINSHLDKRIPIFKFDAGRFSESIKEMLHNALRVMQEQNCGNQINISTQLIDSNVDSSEDKKYVLITIEDDGPGFPVNFPVFSPYHSTDPQRTGLGLATVKELIEAHGGTIKLSQKKEQGTHFEIQLPIIGGVL
ncbi:MAG: GAF domain-containing protein [Candidatus Aminicenantes bacterium]|nr:GAF domain-containing protein [Candidatus Aminicenantes bacterium]NIM84469.1 GAF domain-containing protein [Candidatus Aminicenantes bacterium]NIN23990.1 GAF domain-containing protein [Candidatus Aminicenantes bacterium]NIN47704.1 GAF domain-containing protein [Candidatus Aminicenantes bacterium]NIN90634.1 GAF domain-containing protein [Candidatus Aminicenantes bacterium]